MRKIRSNLNLVLGVGVVALAFLSIALPGCKKKQEPPAPVQVTPLPKKPVQGSMSAVKSAKPSPAGTATTPAAASPAQVKPVAVPGGPVPVPAKPDAAVTRTSTGKPEVQKQVSTARVPQPSSAISLDFSKRRDPFRPYAPPPTPQPGGSGKFPKPVRDLLPIQSFDTERFRVSGIIAGIRENSALVIDPNGKGYIVRAGMLIGSNDGRIKRITASTVEVEENYREDSGKVRKRLVKLALTRKK